MFHLICLVPTLCVGTSLAWCYFQKAKVLRILDFLLEILFEQGIINQGLARSPGGKHNLSCIRALSEIS